MCPTRYHQCHRAGAAPRILLLGTVDLAGAVTSIGSRYQRALFALLALRTGTVVPTEEIIDTLWPGRPPTSPHASVHTYVSRTRRVLARHGMRVQTSSAGYRLVVARDEVDVFAFESALAAARADRDLGDPSAAVARLDHALRWWRGPALADLRAWRFASAAADRMTRVRVEAETLRHRLALTIGRSDGVAGALHHLLDGDPLHEHVAGLLMTALYLEGRQSAALAVYRRTVVRLRDELGVDPEPWLRELHERILSHRLTPAWVAERR